MKFHAYTSMTNTHSGLHRYGHHAKIVHFLGGTKPWHLSYDPQAANESSLRDSSKNLKQFMNLWWVEYYSQRQLQVQKDDKNDDYSVQQLVSPQTHQTPSQSQKSSTEAHHREMMMPSLPLILDSLTISSSSSEKSEESNILFEVLTGGETEETPVVIPPSEHESERTEAETADDSATATGEAAAAETEVDDLEHRRMWEEGRADYMGKDAFNNIMRKLDLFLD